MAERKQPTGFQKPLNPGSVREVGLASITEGEAHEMHYAQCSCGTTYYHKRAKVVDRRMDAHVNDKHGGMAIWL